MPKSLEVRRGSGKGRDVADEADPEGRPPSRSRDGG